MYNGGKLRKLPEMIKSNKTGVLGVSYVTRSRMYRAQYQRLGVKTVVGEFPTIEEAAHFLALAKAEDK